MKKANFKKIFAVLVSLMLIAVIALLMTACADKNGDEITTVKPSVSTTASADITVLGKGETQFLFNITHKNGDVKKFEIHTDKKTVGEALLELELIAGDDSEHGLYVTVDGETLDYDKDKMYWAFYENGNYASVGIDQTTIADGVIYEFRAKK